MCGENVSVLEVYSHAERRHATYIVEGLYLGSATSSSNLTELRHLGIKSILNCAFELPNVFPEEFLYKKLLLKDTKEPIRNIFEECFEFIGKKHPIQRKLSEREAKCWSTAPWAAQDLWQSSLPT